MPIQFKSKLSSIIANATFLDKTIDDIKKGKLTLYKINIGDPDTVQDVQVYLNELADTIGTSEGDANAKNYANENFIANGDSQKTVGEKLDAQMQINRDDIDSNDIDIAQNATDIQAIEDSVGAANGICPLDANSLVPLANIPQEAFDGLSPKGSWDADTNTPDLTLLAPNIGDFYSVSVAGNTDLDGTAVWNVDDWAIYTDAGWIKNIASEVISVNGYKGSVVLDNNDIGLGNVTNDAQLKRSANDFSTFLEKPEPIADDLVLIEDSEDVGNKKYARLENLLGGGAGGGSFIWELNGDISPLEEVLNGISLLSFDYESEMSMHAFLVVPSSYKDGKQIALLDTAFFSGGNSDNVLFRTTTTLFKTGENPLVDVNSHISTNAEKTLTVSNQLESIGVLDLTDAAGLINGVAVTAGDLLKIELKRDNGSETISSVEDAKFLKYSSSLEFNYEAP